MEYRQARYLRLPAPLMRFRGSSSSHGHEPPGGLLLFRPATPPPRQEIAQIWVLLRHVKCAQLQCRIGHYWSTRCNAEGRRRKHVEVGMLVVETIARIRRAFFGQGKPIKAICRKLGRRLFCRAEACRPDEQGRLRDRACRVCWHRATAARTDSVRRGAAFSRW
jgi:hypothetical protein